MVLTFVVQSDELPQPLKSVPLSHFRLTYPALTHFKFSRHMVQCKPSMTTLYLFGYIALTGSVAFLTENISYFDLPCTINLTNIMEEREVTAAVHHPQTISFALSTVISCVCYTANDTMTRGHHETVYDKLMADFDKFTPEEFAELLRDNITEWMTKVNADLARPWTIAASPQPPPPPTLPQPPTPTVAVALRCPRPLRCPVALQRHLMC